MSRKGVNNVDRPASTPSVLARASRGSAMRVAVSAPWANSRPTPNAISSAATTTQPRRVANSCIADADNSA